MRLSEMQTDAAVRVLCALTEPLCRIAEDERTQDVLSDLVDAGLSRMPVTKAWATIGSLLAPLLLHDHAQDTWEIIAALTGKTPQLVRAQPARQTLADLRACWDPELIDFFSCAGCMGQEKS